MTAASGRRALQQRTAKPGGGEHKGDRRADDDRKRQPAELDRIVAPIHGRALQRTATGNPAEQQPDRYRTDRGVGVGVAIGKRRAGHQQTRRGRRTQHQPDPSAERPGPNRQRQCRSGAERHHRYQTGDHTELFDATPIPQGSLTNDAVDRGGGRVGELRRPDAWIAVDHGPTTIENRVACLGVGRADTNRSGVDIRELVDLSGFAVRQELKVCRRHELFDLDVSKLTIATLERGEFGQGGRVVVNRRSRIRGLQSFGGVTQYLSGAAFTAMGCVISRNIEAGNLGLDYEADRTTFARVVTVGAATRLASRRRVLVSDVGRDGAEVGMGGKQVIGLLLVRIRLATPGPGGSRRVEVSIERALEPRRQLGEPTPGRGVIVRRWTEVRCRLRPARLVVGSRSRLRPRGRFDAL